MQKVRCCLLLWVFLLWAVSVQSSVLSDSELSRTINNNYQGLESYSVILSFKNSSLSLRWWQQQEQWRHEWVQDGNLVGVAVGKGNTVLSSLGSEDAAIPAVAILFKGLNWWKDRGLDAGLQSFHFFHGRPALAVGQSGPCDSKACLWLDNEQMVLLRALISSDGKSLDAGFLDYFTLGNFMLPQRIILSFDSWKTEVEADWREINSLYGADLFSAQILNSSFSKSMFTPSEFASAFYRAGQALN